MSASVVIPQLETARLKLRAMRFADFERFATHLLGARARFVGGPDTRRQAWRDVAADAGAVLDPDAAVPTPGDLAYRHPTPEAA
ncbi:MAG: hypothetical protein AAFW46_00815 [Pseudomonadota bacterium]